MRSIQSVISAFVLLAGAPALAQETAPEEAAPEEAAAEETAVEEPAFAPSPAQRPFGSPGKGVLRIHIELFLNMSEDAFGEPLSLPPDVHYGVTDDLAIGLVHGIGICLTGEDNGCPEVYNDVGVDAIYRLLGGGAFELAAQATLAVGTTEIIDAGLFTQSGWDPFRLRLQIGAMGRWTGPVTVIFEPRITFGLTERDAEAGAFENKEFLAIPVEVHYQLSRFDLFAITGFNGPLDYDALDFSDGYAIPLGIGARYRISDNLDVGARFVFPNLLGADPFDDAPGAPDRPDARFLFIDANYLLDVM